MLVTCMYTIVPQLYPYPLIHPQYVLLRALKHLGILLLTTLVRFISSLRLDEVEVVPHHDPGSAMFKGLLQLTLMYSGRHLVGVLSPQDLVKLLVVSSIRQILPKV